MCEPYHFLEDLQGQRVPSTQVFPARLEWLAEQQSELTTLSPEVMLGPSKRAEAREDKQLIISFLSPSCLDICWVKPDSPGEGFPSPFPASVGKDISIWG